jgi:hypothetical protein
MYRMPVPATKNACLSTTSGSQSVHWLHKGNCHTTHTSSRKWLWAITWMVLSHQKQDTCLRMPPPPLQQDTLSLFSSDATDLTRQRKLEHSIVSQVSETYNVNDTSVVPHHAISHLDKGNACTHPFHPRDATSRSRRTLSWFSIYN